LGEESGWGGGGRGEKELKVEEFRSLRVWEKRNNEEAHFAKSDRASSGRSEKSWKSG